MATSAVEGQRLELPQDLPVVEIAPARGMIALRLHDLWEYRDLLYFLVWREIKVRYKQTALGIAWAVLQPLLAMAIFTIFFGHLAKVPTGGVPYAVFAYAALLPWQLFSFALTESSNSLVSNQQLLKKVYFPRLVMPISAVLAGLVDFAISSVMLLILMAIYGVRPTAAVVILPIFILLALATALAAGLWLSALNVQYRDVRHAVPFLTQFWLYATPVVYPSSLVPERWRGVYALNPMTGVVDGFRWALLGAKPGEITPLLISVVTVGLLLLGGLIYFKRVESTLADVV